MSLARDIILRRWHAMLGLARHTPSWYNDRFQEELIELEKAPTRLLQLSEASDVFFSLSRAKYDGCPIQELPGLKANYWAIYGYMLGKYTLRWTFYRVLARLCGVRGRQLDMVREVVNPGKDYKLAQVAARHQIDPVKFTTIGRRLRWVWPMLP